MKELIGQINELELEQLAGNDEVGGDFWDVFIGALPTVPCTKSCNK